MLHTAKIDCSEPFDFADAGKKIKGKKRHILVDTLGLLLHAVVHPADHFGDGAGFLFYKTVGSTALVLSNPVAAPHKRRTLINRFVEEKGDVCFWQISRPLAEILAGLGSHINLANYNFAGPAPAKRNLRRAYNRMLDCGYATRECPAASLNLQELEAVSVKWRRTRSVTKREIMFLVRPVVLEDEPDVRKFSPSTGTAS